MLRDNCPCRWCVSRYSGCHSECHHYIDWRKEMDELNKMINHKKEMARLYEPKGGKRPSQ